MGIFNSFGAMSGQFAAKQERDQIAKGLVNELQAPEKLNFLVNEIERNSPGMLRQWSAGEAPPVSAGELQAALGKDDLIARVSKQTNMPPGVAKSGIAILLPLAVHSLFLTGNIVDGAVAIDSHVDPERLLQALREPARPGKP